MALIKPFKGLRYNNNVTGNMNLLVCPPYDTINKDVEQSCLAKSKFNIVQLEKPQGEDPYKTAAKLLSDWKKQNVLCKDQTDCIYIYEQEFSENQTVKKLKGFICDVFLDDPSKQIVLTHEETLPEPKEDRLNLIKSTFCNFSPIYSLYEDKDNKVKHYINAMSYKNPDIEFTDENDITHRLWIVSNKYYVDKICNLFTKKRLLIADGHHRYETALNFKNYCENELNIRDNHEIDFTMMFLVDIDNDALVLHATHRIIKDLEDFNSEEFLEKCSEYFYIEQKETIDELQSELNDLHAKGESAFGFYAGNQDYQIIKLKNLNSIKNLLPDKNELLKNLDVTVLHSLVLENLLSISSENIENQLNVDYTDNITNAMYSVDNGTANCCFILNPINLNQIKEIAITGNSMPQKTSYFFPKPVTGLVIHELR